MQVAKRNQSVGMRAVCAQMMQSVSEDQQQSPKQLAYDKLFRDKCAENKVNHPFELGDPTAIKKFFSELEISWAEYKDKHDMVD